jgi:hypothetical protein
VAVGQPPRINVAPRQTARVTLSDIFSDPDGPDDLDFTRARIADVPGARLEEGGRTLRYDAPANMPAEVVVSVVVADRAGASSPEIPISFLRMPSFDGLPPTIPVTVTAGQHYEARIKDLLGPAGADADPQRTIITERNKVRNPGAGTLSNGVFRYVADSDALGTHSFDLEVVDASGRVRRTISLVVTVGPVVLQPRGQLEFSISWPAGSGIGIEVHILTPEYRRSSRDLTADVPGNLSNARPGAARFLPRRVDAKAGAQVERVIFDRAARGRYTLAVRVSRVPPTACQRGRIAITYRVEHTVPVTFHRGGYQARERDNVQINLACDASGRLPTPAAATLVEMNVQ